MQPGLLLDHDRVRSLHTEPSLGSLWADLARRAEALLAAPLVPEEEADGPDTQHGDYGRPSGQIADMGLTLGLVHLASGDPRPAERLREALLHYAAYAKWYGRGLRRNDPPWHSELNTARFCFGFATGLDAIRERLAPADRATIADGLVRLGILPTLEDWVLPQTRIHALDSMGHNWWAVCVAMAGLAALALVGEEPRALAWAEAAAEALDLWFNYAGFALQNKTPNFDQGGAFYESVGYANYALSEYLLFRIAYARTVGTPPRIPVLEHAGAFFIHTCYPRASAGILSVDFGDSSLDGDAGRAVTLLLAAGFGGGELRWYAERTRAVEPGLRLLAHREGPPSRRPDALGLSALYPEAGWAVLRSSWEDDATLLAVKCGFTWNHAHADAGSFLLFHGGRPLVVDSGTCSYGRPEYHAYYCQSQAHNVVLFDGQGQSPDDFYRGVKHPGRLGPLIELGDLRYLCADATGPMARHLCRNYRHFLWIGAAILVVDDVRAHGPGRIEWLLHHGGQATVAGSGGVDIADEEARLAVRPLHPEGLVPSRQEGLADHRPDQRVSHLSFALPEPRQEAKFVTALLPGGEDTASVEATAGRDWLGARVRQAGRRADVYLNLRADGRLMHRNSNLVMDGWETDAYLLVVEGVGERVLVVGGSYLRRDGRVLFSSLSKAFAAFRLADGDLEASVRGQPRMRLCFGGVASAPERVTVNGLPRPFAHDREQGLVAVRVED